MNWSWENIQGLTHISIPDWTKQGVLVAFSNRHGGSSHPPYNSLNLGLHVGDQPDSVISNRHQLMQAFSAELSNLVCCQQVHGNNVALVDKEQAGRGALEYTTALADCDGMVCNTPGLVLATFYADCIPIFFFDPVNRAIALAHSGWKGTIDKIAQVTLKKLQLEFGSFPGNIQVFIGPGIGSCCFEIQADLAERVKTEFSNIDNLILHKENKHFWDLRATIYQTLLQNGINPDNIASCELCTSCRTDLFFSYRAEKGTTGRMGAFIGLT